VLKEKNYYRLRGSNNLLRISGKTGTKKKKSGINCLILQCPDGIAHQASKIFRKP
jgi:hypothetical protein